jgi:hypothetical protein
LGVGSFSAENALRLAAFAAPAYPQNPTASPLASDNSFLFTKHSTERLNIAEKKYLWHTTARNFRKEPAMPTAQLAEETLESKSLWFHYKTRIWPEESPQRDVVHNAMRILRSISGFKGLAYASVPITTGPAFYENYRFCRNDQDRQTLLERAISKNYYLGREFADRLTERCKYPVIFPANFEPAHQEWEQPHFQALWLEIIAEMCTEVHMGEGWNLSNGCVEEFVHVMQLRLGIPQHDHLFFYNTKGSEAEERERMRNIKVYDDSGNEISIESGLRIVTNSIAWLNRNRCPSEKMVKALEFLKWTGQMIRQGFYQ